MGVDYMIVDGTLTDYVQEISAYFDQLDGTTDTEGSFEKYTTALMESADSSKIFQAIVDKSPILSQSQEKDFEPAYNLVLHILTFAPDFDLLVPQVVKNLISSRLEFPHASWLILSVLTNLFNILPVDSSLRYQVFENIIDFSEKTDNSHLLVSQISNLSKWVEKWKSVEPKQKKALFIKASRILESTEPKIARAYSLYAVNLSDQPDDETKHLVRMALETDLVYDFDEILSSPAVQALGDSSPLLSLLKLVSSGDIKGLKAINSQKLATEAGVSPDSVQNKAKISALTLLASKSDSRTLTYKEIASAIEVELDEVEIWVINAIRAGLIEGRLSQMEQKFDIHRASPVGKFGKEQWKLIQSRLDSWKSDMRDILQVVQSSRENVKKVY